MTLVRSLTKFILNAPTVPQYIFWKLILINKRSHIAKLKLNDVVQFNENHKWCGVLGIVDEVKELEKDIKYLIGVPVPSDDGVSTAYIFVMQSDMALDRIGAAEYGVGTEEEI